MNIDFVLAWNTEYYLPPAKFVEFRGKSVGGVERWWDQISISLLGRPLLCPGVFPFQVLCYKWSLDSYPEQLFLCQFVHVAIHRSAFSQQNSWPSWLQACGGQRPVWRVYLENQDLRDLLGSRATAASLDMLEQEDFQVWKDHQDH